MRRNALRGLGLLLGAATAAGSAQAADLPARTPPVFAAPPVINIEDWSGVYVGTTYGYNFSDSFRNRNNGLTRSRDADGQTGGALVGYNFQAGRVVFGAEGSIDLSVVRSNNPPAGAFVGAHNDSLYDIRFRGILGYTFGRLMPFIAGGAVLNEGYMSGVGGVGQVPTWYGRNVQTVGYTLGAGLEYKLFPQELFPGLPSWLFGPVTLRAEYIYDNLPTETYAYGGQVYRTKSSSNIVRGALIYRFGDNPPRPYADAAGDVNWGGGYGGILGGYGSPGLTVRNVTPNGTRINRSIDADGGLGGIYAGTNFMFNRVMLGFDGSTSFSDFTGSRAVPLRTTGNNPASDQVSYRGYVQADIRARLGYAFGNFLPFVDAGYAFSRGELVDRVTGSQRGRVPVDSFTAGGGIDYRVSQRVSFRIEDLYEFGSDRKQISLNGTNTSVTRDANIVRAGFAYHFE